MAKQACFVASSLLCCAFEVTPGLLGREWASTGDYKAPTLERSPEVYHVLREMDATGVDFFIDVHGGGTPPQNVQNLRRVAAWLGAIACTAHS